jgi:hypothetical protein
MVRKERGADARCRLQALIRVIESALLVIAASCTSTPTASPSPVLPSLLVTPTAVLTPRDADRYGLVISSTVRCVWRADSARQRATSAARGHTCGENDCASHTCRTRAGDAHGELFIGLAHPAAATDGRGVLRAIRR